MPLPTHTVNALGLFLRADAEGLHGWAARSGWPLVGFCVTVIVFGAGLYGAVIGSWWAPLQAAFVSIKLPLLMLLTTVGNGLLNGMLAPLLGVRITFRQSVTAVLVSFAISSAILGALSPVALFVVWNTPPLTNATCITSREYCLLQLTLVAFIAFSGVVGNVRLLPVLEQWTRRRKPALKVLCAWLAGNLFLGSQLCWILRPFIWDQSGHVRFVGPNCFQGSFFETVFMASRRLLGI